jgi:hypothetical protein
MSNLLYTNGKDGNGITAIKELIDYFMNNPIALFDCGFLRSYYVLIMKTFEKRSSLNLNVDEEEMFFKMYDHAKNLYFSDN